MKKKNKKNHIRMRFSTLLLCCLAFVLCAAPCYGEFLSMRFTGDGVYCNEVNCNEYYNENGEYNVTEQLIDTVREKVVLGEGLDVLEIGAGATVNLYTDVSQSVYVYPGGILNIYSGSVGLYVILTTGETKPIVTVYGKNFNVSNGAIDPEGKWLPIGGSGILTVTYSVNGEAIELLFFSDGVPIKLKETDSKVVEIDIKPGGNPNNINLRSKGVVPVAVLTTESFDAGDVDPETVEFAGAEPVRWRLCDVNDDGYDDLLFHFKTQELQDLDENSTEATLTGTTFGGEDIELTDEVRIVPQKKKK